MSGLSVNGVRHDDIRVIREPEVDLAAVLRTVRQEAANLFAGDDLTPLPDGTFEAVSPHRPV